MKYQPTTHQEQALHFLNKALQEIQEWELPKTITHNIQEAITQIQKTQ